jgi:hypothetical protein
MCKHVWEWAGRGARAYGHRYVFRCYSWCGLLSAESALGEARGWVHATTGHTIVMEIWEDLRPLVERFGSFVHLPCTWRHSIEPAVPLLGSDGAHPMRLERLEWFAGLGL